ncbi:hypothetical protein [uncultured Agrococcus sp.]|uniref:hypothetical protein n=1 Tax=uncultured Agrococcus sp. TaxID=382258 RepID=UPI0025DD83FC|nr:hypothetical protein [uncultured Agrococcus sp.]
MFERKTDLESGQSEPDWLREADRLIGQSDAPAEPDVIESVAQGVSATQSLQIIFGDTVEGDE